MLKKVFEVILCSLLAVAIAVGTGVAYLYLHQKWIFAPPEPTVGLPVAGALYGVDCEPNKGWYYAKCPELIRDKAEMYPEAIEYAANYIWYGDNHLSTDISADVAAEDVPLLLQWDKRWGYRLYGTNYMGNNGCGPTALSIVYAGLTGKSDFSPYEIAMYAMDEGLYWARQGTHQDLMTVGAEYLGLTVQFHGKDAEAIRDGLRDGQLMIAHVTAGDFTTGGHFIVFSGLTDDGQLIILDPNSRITSSVTWDFNRVLEQTTKVWGYTYEPVEE